MKLLNGKKQKNHENSDESTMKFDRRIPKWEYRPSEYYNLKRFDNLKTELDEYLEKLFKGEIDSGNGNVLDNLISDVMNETIKEIGRQRVNHKDTIEGLSIFHNGSEEEFRRELEHIDDELNRLSEKLVLAEERYENYRFISEVN